MGVLEDALQTVATKLKNSGISAKDLLSSSPSDIASSIDDTSDSFEYTNTRSAVLGGTSQDTIEARTTAKKNASLLSEGVSGQNKADVYTQQVSFVTSTSKRSLENPELTNISTGVDTRQYTDEELQRLSNLYGTEEIDDETAYQDLNKWFEENSKTSASKSTTLKNGLVAEDESIFGGIKSTTQGTQDTFSRRNVSTITQESLSDLPPNMRRSIGGVAGNEAGKIGNRVGAINNKINSIENFGSNASDIILIASGNYPEATDENGNPIPGLSNSDIAYKKIDALYRDARYLCDGIGDNFSAFAELKDIFDLLLREAMNSGLARLLRQLLECGTAAGYGGRIPYYDTRSNTILSRGVKTAASNGDPYTLNVAQDYIGKNNIQDPFGTGLTVATNMDYNDSSSAELDTYLSSHNYTKQDLFMDHNAPSNTINSQSVTLVSSKNSKLVDDTLSKDTRVTAIKLLDMFN